MNSSLRGYVACVDFADILDKTLRSNASKMTQCTVITSPHDRETQELCASIPNVRAYVTDAFYRQGAFFNKGAAISSALEAFPPTGWTLIFDTDIIFPDHMPLDDLNPDILYGCKRRMVHDPANWNPETPWSRFPIHGDGNRLLGYFQLAHPSSRFLRDVRPWYSPVYTSACGSDADFQNLWPPSHRRFLPFEVLHLGPPNQSWFGRATPRLDGTVPPEAEERRKLTQRFLNYKGWLGRPRSGESFPERIEQ